VRRGIGLLCRDLCGKKKKTNPAEYKQIVPDPKQEGGTIVEEDLIKLLDLQTVDHRINQLRRDKGDYPKRIEALEEALQEAEEILQTQQDRIAELKKMGRHYERELAQANEALKSHEARLYEVKTNKEYDALQHEIEAWQDSVDQNETSLVETMTELEELTVGIEEEAESSEEARQARRAEIESLKSKLDVIETQTEQEQQAREKLTQGVKPRLLAGYERIRKAKGDAVARVTRQACGGCFTRLPPQLMAELRKRSRIIHCENCGRMLVWDERST
jgi:predicted  nucleic acid-binding Zn-ribbon protein